MPVLNKISEARLNDLVYVFLKYTFFLPAMNSNPRECDIRVCMDLTVLSRAKKDPMRAMILLPNEEAGRSHETFYDVDTDRLTEVCLDYISDHWMKQEIPASVRDETKNWYADLLPTLLAIPEEQCGCSDCDLS